MFDNFDYISSTVVSKIKSKLYNKIDEIKSILGIRTILNIAVQ